MSLKKITIIQIGDVHYPEWQPEETPIDVKLSEFSPTIVSNLRTNPLASILGELRRLTRAEPIDAVVLMGDFTSRGEVDLIQDAVLVLDGLINDSEPGKIPVFGVPGNHDVRKADAVELGDVGKFRALEAAFAAVGWRQPPLQSYVQYEVNGQQGTTAPIFLLNSSIGSWSKALYPEGIRERIFTEKADETPLKVADAVPFGDTRSSTNQPVSITEQVYEQLDTPYFRALDIEAMTADIERVSKTAIVVSHHNILPQYIPRISYFGEVLNAGFARQQLLLTGTNIVYLHGHIHDDPIEVVTSGSGKAGKLISISAPTIMKGFNRVEIYYTEEGNAFLLKVTSYRADESGRIRVGEVDKSAVIPLMDDRRALLTRDVYRLWQYLKNDVAKQARSVFNWAELTSCCKAADVSLEQLDASVLSLFAADMISITNFSGPVSSWRVEVKE